MSEKNKKPPYSCPVTVGGTQKCSYPNCMCSWQLSSKKQPEQPKLTVEEAAEKGNKPLFEISANIFNEKYKSVLPTDQWDGFKTGYSNGFYDGYTHALTTHVDLGEVVEVINNMSAVNDKYQLKSTLISFGFKKGNGEFYEHKKNGWYAEILEFQNFCEVWLTGNGLPCTGFPGGKNYNNESLINQLKQVIKNEKS